MITAIVFVKADVARIPEVAEQIAALDGRQRGLLRDRPDRPDRAGPGARPRRRRRRGRRPAQQGPRRHRRPRPTSRSAPTPGTTSSRRSPSASTDDACGAARGISPFRRRPERPDASRHFAGWTHHARRSCAPRYCAGCCDADEPCRGQTPRPQRPDAASDGHARRQAVLASPMPRLRIPARRRGRLSQPVQAVTTTNAGYVPTVRLKAGRLLAGARDRATRARGPAGRVRGLVDGTAAPIPISPIDDAALAQAASPGAAAVVDRSPARRIPDRGRRRRQLGWALRHTRPARRSRCRRRRRPRCGTGGCAQTSGTARSRVFGPPDGATCECWPLADRAA